MHCSFFFLLKPNLDFLQAVKVTKSGYRLFHNRASKGYGSIPGLMSQTSLHACLQDLQRCKSICDIKPGIDPCPLLAWSWDRWWLDFVTFTAYKKSEFKFKKAQRVSNRCIDLFRRKKFFGVRSTSNNNISSHKVKCKHVYSLCKIACKRYT